MMLAIFPQARFVGVKTGQSWHIAGGAALSIACAPPTNGFVAHQIRLPTFLNPQGLFLPQERVVLSL